MRHGAGRFEKQSMEIKDGAGSEGVRSCLAAGDVEGEAVWLRIVKPPSVTVRRHP